MIRAILAAVDGSDRAPGVIRAASELAERFDAQLHVFRAVMVPPEFPAAAAGWPADKLGPQMVATAQAELGRLIQDVPRAQAETAMIVVGQIWRAILGAAERLAADLIVIGSHGYGGFDWLIGTTAGKVANHARCHVFIVHDPNETRPLPKDDETV